MERKFVFKLNGYELPNFKMCDLTFMLESYPEHEVILEVYEMPQHLIIRGKDTENEINDYWEVIEEDMI